MDSMIYGLRCAAMAALCLLFAPHAPAAAVDKADPPNWPWRGVQIPAAAAERHPGIIERLARKKVNAVRIYINAKRDMPELAKDGEAVWRQNLRWVHQLLDDCRTHGITAVLASDTFPVSSERCNDKREPSYWNDPLCIGQMMHFIDLASDSLRDRGAELSAYAFMSEPVVIRDGRPALPGDWESIVRRIITVIRKNDPARFILVSPGEWGSARGFGRFPLSDQERIIYNVHMYEPHRYTHQGIRTDRMSNDLVLAYPGRIGFTMWNKGALDEALAPLTRFQSRHGVLVCIGEFSVTRWAQGRDRYLADVIDVFEAHGWPWFYHSVGGYEGWDPDYEPAGDILSGKRTDLVHRGDASPTWTLLERYFRRTARQPDLPAAAPRTGAGTSRRAVKE